MWFIEVIKMRVCDARLEPISMLEPSKSFTWEAQQRGGGGGGAIAWQGAPDSVNKAPV